MAFKIGDRVQITTGSHYGKIGEIVEYEDGKPLPYNVMLLNGAVFVYDAADLKNVKKPKPAQTYLGNGKHQWELVTAGTERLRVPGGWMYETPSAAVFVPLVEVTGHVI